MSTNIQNAKNLVSTRASGDAALATSLLEENYIQHNQAQETGRDAFVALVNKLAQAPEKTTVKTIRAFEDGDKVFLHNVYNLAGEGEKVAFDIFRFNENGLIAEYWDNIQEMTPPNPSGRTLVDGVATVVEDADTETSREIATNFIYDVLHGQAPDKMNSYFDGVSEEKYLQHNPGVADGLLGLLDALAEMEKQGMSMVYYKTYQILAQNDFVLSVSEGEFAGQHVAFYDLFRIENGFIAEHWDVIEPISAEKANDNGKF